MIDKYFAIISAGLLLLLGATSCLDSDTEDYHEWRVENDEYLAAIDTDEYTLVVPDWAPQNSVYIKWHNDRSLTADNLVPMSNSTVSIKYDLYDIDGEELDNSYSNTDSLYTSQPNSNVLGMWIALTTMHVGDSCTLVVPYSSGYGASASSSIKPYTNLIFNVKLVQIDAYEKPNS